MSAQSLPDPEPPEADAEPQVEPPRYSVSAEVHRVQETRITVREDGRRTDTAAVRAEMRLAQRDGRSIVVYEPLDVFELDIDGAPLPDDAPEVVAGASGFGWVIDELGHVDYAASGELPRMVAQQERRSRAASDRGPYAPEVQAMGLLEDALRLPVLPRELPPPGMELVYSETTEWDQGRVVVPLLQTSVWTVERGEDGRARWKLERTAYGSDEVESWGLTTLQRTEHGTLTLDPETNLPLAFELRAEQTLVNEDGNTSEITEIKSVWKTQ